MAMPNTPEEPYSREEEYLASIAGQGTPVPEVPYSRKEAYLNAIDGRVSGMDSDIEDLNQKVAALATDFSYKGSVATYADLPANPAVGDVYTTEDEGYMYVWDGNSWQILNMQGGGGGGPTVVQTAGTSTTDVMSQNAASSLVYSDITTGQDVRIGVAAKVASGSSAHSVAVGNYADASGNNAVAIGGSVNNNSVKTRATANSAIAIKGYASGVGSVAIGGDGTLRSDASGKGSIALGAGATATNQGQVDIGTSNTAYGYNSSNYRLITGVHDGQNLHDAATLAQGNTLSDTAPTTSTIGVLGQLYTDVTNMHTYQCTGVSGNTYTWTQRW